MTHDRPNDYWSNLRRQRLTRRQMLRASGLAGVGATGLALVGCGDDDDDDQQAEQQAQQQEQMQQEQMQQEPMQQQDEQVARDAPNRGGTISTGWELVLNSLDVHSETALNQATTSVFSKLLRQVKGGIEPDLAVSLPETPDATTVNFTIHEGVRFHDIAPANGRELTADDVVFSLNRVRTDDPAFQNARFLSNINTLEAPDATTVSLTTKIPFAPQVTFLAAPYMVVVPPEVVDAGGGDLKQGPLIGSGPFINETADRQVQFVNVRNPDYFVPDRPFADGGSVQQFTEVSTRVLTFRSGDLTYMAAAKEDYDSILADIPDVGLEELSGSRSKLSLNSQHELFSDGRIRTAMHLGIDRPEVANLLHQGAANVYAFLPRFFPGALGDEVLGRPGWRDNKEEDLAEARALLAAAGRPDGFHIPEWNTPTSSDRSVDAAVVHTEQLKKIGITTDIMPLEYADWLPRNLDHNLLISSTGTSNRLDPDDHFFTEVHSTGARNDGNLQNAEVDRLVEEQRSSFDLEERKAIWRQLEEILITELPYIPTVVAASFLVWQPGVTGVSADGGRVLWNYFGSNWADIALPAE